MTNLPRAGRNHRGYALCKNQVSRLCWSPRESSTSHAHMKTNYTRAFYALLAMASFVVLTFCAQAQFPARGDDTTQSLGQFRIVVNPAFQGLMVGYPGYSATTKRLTSPLLYDPSTIIGRSDPLLDGSGNDAAGVAVGSAGTIISDSSLSVQPAGLGPVGTREVHTELRSMNMTGGGAAVRAGTTAADQPTSAGEVESWSGPGGTAAEVSLMCSWMWICRRAARFPERPCTTPLH